MGILGHVCYLIVSISDLCLLPYFALCTILRQVVLVRKKVYVQACRRVKFCQRGSNYENVFFSLMRGGRVNLSLWAGHHWPASESPFKWRFVGVPMMAQH